VQGNRAAAIHLDLRDTMGKKLLIDATHAEETRVVVLDGNKVDEFDFETVHKRQLAGNIYLAKVTRVEPSLQAAFVDYGGNRHGFLAFAEIHPDYYQIPVADRKALLEEERSLQREGGEDDDEGEARRSSRRRDRPRRGRNADATPDSPVTEGAVDESAGDAVQAPVAESDAAQPVEAPETGGAETGGAETGGAASVTEAQAPDTDAPETDTPRPAQPARIDDTDAVLSRDIGAMEIVDLDSSSEDEPEPYRAVDHAAANDDQIEAVGDDDVSDEVRPARRPRSRRYKIQEVIKVRQIMLVQVVKEERGNKGAALTTYLSLAGRYCVLMPNTGRGGGISRKITNVADRKKLKEIASEIEVPEGAGLIIRTAGANRTKAEIKRDYEYLFRLWEQIRELTLKSIAPAPIYEEGNLIKRAIRDLYSRDIDEVLVEGEAGYRAAKDFMKMIMPSHAKNVQPYTEPMPLFARYQVESYLAGMFNPTVQLKSGGYIVIGITEALVAIDVNSGKATRQGSIEETALQTNLEAADEIARQLRLRDLAGLIVIDFIDMEERKNNASVEKRLKERLANDRARIQLGRISGFGLLEMSRQRLRPGMLEATTQPCPHCHGTGLIRSDNSLALTILRALEEEGTRGRSKEVLVKAPVGIVNYMFNSKREHLLQIEARYGMAIRVEADPALISPDYSIEKFKTATRILAAPQPQVVSLDARTMSELDDARTNEVVEEEDISEDEVATTPAAAPAREGEEPRKKRRRRRRRRGGSGADGAADEGNGDEGSDDEGSDDEGSVDEGNPGEAVGEGDAAKAGSEAESIAPDADAPRPARRRRRGGRKSGDDAEAPAADAPATDAPATGSPATEGADAPSAPELSEKAPAKPRRSRKKKADAEPAAQAPAEMPESAPPVAAPEAEAPKAVVAEAPVAEAAATETATAAPETVEEPTGAATGNTTGDADATEAPSPDTPPAAPRPRRAGWWSRGK